MGIILGLGLGNIRNILGIISNTLGDINIERRAIECGVCANFSPRQTLEIARGGIMTSRGLTLAESHLDHYLSGSGADFPEDLEAVIRKDAGVRRVLAQAISTRREGFVEIKQGYYANPDFLNSFGDIDRLDYEVIAASGQVHVWFQDRYEWHPEDRSRISNCVHKAAVELKDEGAQDYWMIGEATVPMSLITAR